MVQFDNTEQEQIEALKRWWEDNGRSVLVGIGVFLAVVLGWQTWTGYQNRKAEAASGEYETLLAALDSDAAKAQEIGRRLVAQYPSSAYAGFAALSLAKLAVEQGDLDGAAAQLRWVMEQGQPQDVRPVARERLARVLLAQQKPEEALKVLDGGGDGSLRPLFDELKGDILLAQGKRAEAYAAYSNAHAGYDVPAKRTVVRMKMDDLADAAGEKS